MPGTSGVHGRSIDAHGTHLPDRGLRDRYAEFRYFAVRSGSVAGPPPRPSCPT